MAEVITKRRTAARYQRGRRQARGTCGRSSPTAGAVTAKCLDWPPGPASTSGGTPPAHTQRDRLGREDVPGRRLLRLGLLPPAGAGLLGSGGWPLPSCLLRSLLGVPTTVLVPQPLLMAVLVRRHRGIVRRIVITVSAHSLPPEGCAGQRLTLRGRGTSWGGPASLRLHLHGQTRPTLSPVAVSCYSSSVDSWSSSC